MIAFSYRYSASFPASNAPITMDLNTKFTLLFGILATVLAIIAIWAATKHKGWRCQCNNQPIVTNSFH